MSNVAIISIIFFGSSLLFFLYSLFRYYQDKIQALQNEEIKLGEDKIHAEIMGMSDDELINDINTQLHPGPGINPSGINKKG